jgi:hypothetical protein
MPDIVHTLAHLSGRRIPFVIVPSWFLAGFGHTADFVQRRLKARLPWSSEAIWIMNCHARCDDSTTRNELGLEPRPLRDTFADTVQWLVEVGELSHVRPAGLPEPSVGLLGVRVAGLAHRRSRHSAEPVPVRPAEDRGRYLLWAVLRGVVPGLAAGDDLECGDVGCTPVRHLLAYQQRG